MSDNFSYSEFYRELETSLPTSTAEKRRIWATTIIEKNIDIKELSNLLKGEQKIAIRFLWLLSEIGTFNQSKLYDVLPYFLDLSVYLDPNYKTSLIQKGLGFCCQCQIDTGPWRTTIGYQWF